MKARVYELLDESGTSPRFWTEAKVERALNDGLECISDASEWYEAISPIPILARQTYYDLRGLINTVLTPLWLQIPGGLGTTTTQWLIPVTVRDLDGEGINLNLISYPRWEQITGLFKWVFMRGLFWLGVSPRATSDSGIMRLNHTSLPLPMIDDNDEPDFPEEFHLGLVEYALYDLFIRDQEVGLALLHYKEYVKYETGLTQHVGSRQSTDRVWQMSAERPIQ